MAAMSCQDDDKWKIFTDSLRKVQVQVHPNLDVKTEALQYIEKLIIDLLHTICSCKPVSSADVIEQVRKTFPKPIDRWAIQDANYALDKKKHKKGEKSVILPVDKVHPLLRELLGYRLDQQVTLCIVAVLEYVAADILKLVGNYVRHIHAEEITEEDVRVSMCADKVLNNMFFSNDSDDGPDTSAASYGRRDDRPLMSAKMAQQLTQTYEDLVKDLITSEQQNIRELELIIKVFRPPFVDLFPSSKDIDVIFSNIVDVHSFCLRFCSMLEDTVEVTEKDQIPLIGGCFEDMLEGAEFDVYEKYMSDVTNKKLQYRLYALLTREDLTAKLNSYDHGFKDVVKYLLPRLLEGPIHHLKYCFNVMDKLKESGQSTEEDQESFNQAHSLLIMLRIDVDKKLSQLSAGSGAPAISRRQNYGSMCHISDRESASAMMTEIQKSIENWEDKDINKQCYDFLLKGDLIIQERAKDRERHGFLFDTMLILCKPTGQRKNAPSGQEYRFKEKLLIKHLDVSDLDDTDELKHAFEVQDRNGTVLVLRMKTAQEKEAWMAALLSLLFRSNLDRMLDSKQKEEESAHSLILPPVEEYPFSEEDSEENIVLEESQNVGEPPLIQGATLNKLIERLTYHMYADPNFVKRFLTTYRSFCSPSELLHLLITRFQIPETNECFEENRGAFTRFKKEYVKPVQFRVLNVIRLWTDHHFYDFERESKVLEELETFLATIKGKVMRKWVDSIIKIIKRKIDISMYFKDIGWETSLSHLHLNSPKFKDEPPSVEWFFPIQDEPERFNIVYLHPIEIARQETLIEFKLYKAVKPSELVGSVFTKKDKAIQSPNLMKLIQQTNRFTLWLEMSILATQNLEERVSVVSRIIEIMQVFRKLNNFNGVLCVVSALDSAPIHRLNCTFELLKPFYKKCYEDNKELISNNFKRYFEVLRAIDPPCVPFFGVYMSNILKLEEGNPDCLPNTDLINFNKRRKVADITAEIQQYQNQPYNLTTVYSIAEFLESLDPWAGKTDTELDDYLYELSLTIEPRNQKPPPKFAKKYDAVALKSPGIKAANKQTTISAFKSHFPSFITSTEPSRFPFPNAKHSMTDDEDGRSTISSSTSPGTPITPPPRPHTPQTPPPCTPPPTKHAPPRTPPHYQRSYIDGSHSSLLSESSTVRESQVSLFSQFSATSTATLTNHAFDLPDADRERYNLKPPPLPPRRSSTAQSVTDNQSLGSVSTLNLDSPHYSRLGSVSSLSSVSAHHLSDYPRGDNGFREPHRPEAASREHLHRPDMSHRSSDAASREHLHRPDMSHRSSDVASREHLHRPDMSHRSSDAVFREHPHKADRTSDAPLRDHPRVRLRDNVHSLRDLPPQLPPKLPSRSSVHNLPYSGGGEGEQPPRLPPRPSRSRGIERSGSMPDHTENRYTSRRNSGEHVNMNGVTPGTPQLPPRTYRPPRHGRQRSQ